MIASKKGHKISARDGLLRAYSYNRVGSIGLSPSESIWPENYKKEVSCFQNAAALMDSPIEPIAIPYRDGKCTDISCARITAQQKDLR
jgi:hypothetical protein